MAKPSVEMQENVPEGEVRSAIQDLETQAADLKAYVNDAKHATIVEHDLSLWKALKSYRKAVMWSFIYSMLIVMESYDGAFIGSLYAQQTFNKRFGEPAGDGTYQVPARWQTALTVTGNIGNILGVFIDGYMTNYLGHRRLVLVALVWLTAFIFMNFFAQSLAVIMVGRMLMSIPFGIFSTTPTTYASEVCPVKLRGYLTTYVCLCWVIGQFIAAGVTDSVKNITTSWSYRIPFAVQWAWPLPLFIGVYFSPESPWWYVRKGRYEQAEKSIKRLSNEKYMNSQEVVAMMIRSDQLESSIETGTYWDCFKGVDLRRTEIACMTWAVQALCGSAIQGYTTYFFEVAGLSSDVAFDMNLGNNGLTFIGTALSWVLISYCGRRQIYLWGCVALTVILFIIGFVSLAPDSNNSAKWVLSVMVMIQLFVYAPTAGATCYPIVGEVGAIRLRSKTVCLARNTYNILEIVIGIITPYQLNPTAGNWKGKIGFFWGVSCLFCTIWIYFRLPETGGRTYEELDLLFQQVIPARKFASTHVDPYAEEEADVVRKEE